MLVCASNRTFWSTSVPSNSQILCTINASHMYKLKFAVATFKKGEEKGETTLNIFYFDLTYSNRIIINISACNQY